VSSSLLELVLRARWRVRGVEKVAVAKGEKILTRLGQVVCPLHYVRFVVNTRLGEK
jgi:hypothetical protein